MPQLTPHLNITDSIFITNIIPPLAPPLDQLSSRRRTWLHSSASFWTTKNVLPFFHLLPKYFMLKSWVECVFFMHLLWIFTNYLLVKLLYHWICWIGLLHWKAKRLNLSLFRSVLTYPNNNICSVKSVNLNYPVPFQFPRYFLKWS